MAFVALQAVAVVWATDRRSAAVLRGIAPALSAAGTVAAMWTALVLAVPGIASGDVAALVALLAVAPAVAASSRRRAGRRVLPPRAVPPGGAPPPGLPG